MRGVFEHYIEEKNCNRKRIAIINILLLSIFILLISGYRSLAQDDNYYDEVTVMVSIQGIGSYDMPGIIKNDNAYLPVTVLFDLLKIKNTSSEGFNIIDGFFITTDSTYSISYKDLKLTRGKRVYPLLDDRIIQTETGLYLKTSVYHEAFGLKCAFNYRALSIKITTDVELPAIRDARLKAMRDNISKLRDAEIADTYINRSYPLFHFGMFDWSVISNQIINDKVDTRIGAGFGGILFGGETNVLLNYSTNQPNSEKQQMYLWKYVDNDNVVFKQLQVGKVPIQATSSIFAPFVGAQISNISTTLQRSFGSYILTNRTEPGWLVELYVNNVLIDYKKADEAGLFTFEVPLVYGSSAVKLRFYGPFGEERTKEESITIPYNLLQVKQFQYNLSAGVLEDKDYSKFSRLNLNYGLAKRITIGTGAEYLSSVSPSNTMPFVNTAMRIGRSMLIAGEYTYGVKTRGVMSYRNKRNTQLELSYIKYDKNQTAINTQVLEERKGILTVPIRMKHFSMFSQITVNQSLLANTEFVNTEWLLSGYVGGVDANLSTYGIFYKGTDPTIYSNISLGFRVPFRMQLRSVVQYKYNTGQVVSMKESLDKNVGNTLSAGLFVENNFISDIQNIGFQFRYNLSYTQIGVNSLISNNKIAIIESARGGIMFDAKGKYVGLSNMGNISKGGIVIEPFLDVNCNGNKEENEPKVSGLKFYINGGNVQPEGSDTVIRILNLEPYIKYHLELNKYCFDNIAWQIQKLKYSIAVDGNSFKHVGVPIFVVGEVNGTVYMNKDNRTKGQGQIYVCIYQNKKMVTKVLSEPDGYFSYIGLAPGEYTAQLDSAQMKKINMTPSNPINFTIHSNPDGDVIDGLEFTITNKLFVKKTYSNIIKGSVIAKQENTYKQQELIYVYLYKNGVFTARTLTDAGGAYQFKEIVPGTYVVVIDTIQIQKIQMVSSPPATIVISDTATAGTFTVPQFILQTYDPDFENEKNIVRGSVLLQDDNEYVPQEAVAIYIYKDGLLVNQTLTDLNGQFMFTNLSSGEYSAQLDTAKLKSIGMTASSDVKFTVTYRGETIPSKDLVFTIRMARSRKNNEKKD